MAIDHSVIIILVGFAPFVGIDMQLAFDQILQWKHTVCHYHRETLEDVVEDFPALVNIPFFMSNSTSY
jgi:hypothetical protein